MGSPKPLLVIRHVPWEGPHRILDAFPGVAVGQVDILESDTPLPEPQEVCGVVVMGGPMSANDTAIHPRLAEELRWLEQAVAVGLPILGVCLGSQMLARALGASIARGREREIGFAPIEVLDHDDQLVGPLTAAPTVLHWHGEVFDLPSGAVALARSEHTDVQAFRYADHAWGLLFHAEADEALVGQWLAEPTMAAEARDALGSEYESILREDASRIDAVVGAKAFRAFASCC
jgi:GMP synthase (glutamine-hydrolysing)